MYMRSRIVSCITTNDGRLVPRAIVAEFANRGDPVITMRYGNHAVQKHGRKARADYTLTARKHTTSEETFYHGYVATPATATDIAFLFDDIGPTGSEDEGLDDVFVSFIQTLLEATNTDDEKWFVEPTGRPLQTALADYPYYIDADACERDIEFYAPDADVTFTRPGNLTMQDLRFVSLVEQASVGDVLLETDAAPQTVRADTWFDRACDGVGDAITLRLTPRADGGTQFVVAACDS